MRPFKLFLILCSFFLFTGGAQAKVKLPRFISDGLVLQRDIQLPLWGWGAPGEEVTITFNGKVYTTKTTAGGKWSLKIPPVKSGGPFEMTVKGTNEITIKNILVGDVWVCGGQSNMEWKIGSLREKYQQEIAASANDNIRQFEIERKESFTPVDTIDSKGWKPASPDNLPDFSAVGYFFAKDIYEKYKIPVGLIYANRGGTPAQSWLSVEALKQFPNYYARYEEVKSPEGQEKQLKKHMDMQSEWYNKSKVTDKGYPAVGKNWTDPSFDDSQWKTMKLPAIMEEKGLPGFDGVVWFRKKINIPKELAGKDAVLHLSCVDDADSTFFNGAGVGYGINGWQQRKYTVPGSLVKEGENVIVVRLIDNWSNGGITGNGPMKLTIDNKDIPLDTDWKYQESSPASDFPQYSWGFEYHKFCEPAIMYNSQIVPLLPFAIKGVIWYQGEANAGDGYEYRRLFPYMISEWRKSWGQGDFPFIYVQLANFMSASNEPSESEWAELREAQLMTLTVPNTGMAVIIDIGEANDIHPKNKKDVGKRLALSAQKVAYNDQKVVYSGPTCKSVKVQGDKIILTFDNIGSGLIAKGGGELKQFAIAGEDKKFIWAKAIIEGNTIIVSSDQVRSPVAVRYAWANNPEGCNLYNKEGLPASPFRTDNWPRFK